MPRINFLDPILGEHDLDSPLNTAAPAGSVLDQVPAGAGPKNLVRLELPPLLIVGSGGGVGTTATTLGIAAAAATTQHTGTDVVAVDATACGGNLARRGADAQVSVATIQTWLATPQPGLRSAVNACTGRSSTGVKVLTRSPDPLPFGDTVVSVRHHLAAAHCAPVFDGGNAVSSRLIAPLIADARVGLALVVSARADSLNSLNETLGYLVDRHGEWLIGRIVIVVCHQLPGGFGAGAVEHVRTHLAKWVRAVEEIPYDRHLAAGGVLIWERLEDATRTAYRHILGGLS